MALEQRGSVIQLNLTINHASGRNFLKTTKPFEISKHDVVRAWELVKANKGAPGVNGETIEQFESNLKGNLYKLWNRMSSGSYFPPAVKTVAIPKKTGGASYGYRPNKSAHMALEVTRKRCWRHNWVLEFDIRGLFDNIDHQLLMKAVKRHTDNRWLLLYIERWLTGPIQLEDGTTISRKRGVPQGGVISPVLSNLFMHYAFDKWMERHFPGKPFCRYADDGLVHCHSEADARMVKDALANRLQECGLEMHPEKTKIVYCKDDDRREEHAVTSFDFLGYTFRPRRSKNKWGKFFINFSPAMSATAGKAIRQEVRRWKLHLRSDKSLLDLAQMFRAKIQGWINYYGRFYKSAMYPTLKHINRKLCLWAMRKYKKLKHHRRRAEHRLGDIANMHPGMFPHWKLGVRPMVG